MACGHYIIFLLAFLTVAIWALSGPFFHYSAGWELVINTGTTIVTFLMVFLIQNTQNRDSLAIHLKLDEIILAIKDADNKFIHSENVSNEELEDLTKELDTKVSTNLNS